MFVGINGKPGTGKDTLADYFVKNFHFTKLSLADQIRNVTMAATGLSLDALRNHPEKDIPIEEFFNKTGRELTIEVGISIERLLGPSIWNNLLDKIIKKNNFSKIVVPDIRTQVQANWIKEHNGILIKIESNEKSLYYIENQLNNYKHWDFIITKEEWFQGPSCLEEIENYFKAR
tara:strand:- start:1085 stop:1609 length:525 start_codon:yes stop_codon:yes gene_type:complete